MKLTGILVLFCLFLLKADAQQPYWQQQVNYTIEVSLNDIEHTLDGFEQMEYVNNAPDTLRFIWIHLWAIAYKNDRTAFTDQQLENGSTDFYFSNAENRGYINRLAFKINGSIAVMEDHPQHQDIVKIYLPVPLAPGQHCTIETPFHVKLPYNFSRGGHVGQSYQVTQWYPKAAVYDKKGWHEMPYLDQGEFYSDFGNYKVTINLPSKYTVAATGELSEQDASSGFDKSTAVKNTKTLVYKQDNVIDFAWFADGRFIVKQDTLALPSGRIIQVASYSLPAKHNEANWNKGIQYIKKAVLSRSRLIGEYPYQTITAVQGDMKYSGGMEYPTITLITGAKTERALEAVIEHEAGHNWLYGILASNERRHPWMDEGMNDYYKNRYTYEPIELNTKKKTTNTFFTDRLPSDYTDLMLRYVESERKGQPIETASEKFTALNYGLHAYYKASQWMMALEKKLGTDRFDSCMRNYYRQWKFKHPYPEDVKASFENTSGTNLDYEFNLLNTTTGSPKPGVRATVYNAQKEKIQDLTGRKIKLKSCFSFKDTDKYKYIFVAPAVGYNLYDKQMFGLSVHNYTLPAEKLQFFIAPLYATGSKQFNGIGTINYHWYPQHVFRKVEVGLNGSSFSSNHSLDSTGKKVFENYYRAVPYARFYLNHPARSTLSGYFDLRTFIIGEKLFDSYDSLFRPSSTVRSTHYINQLSFTVDNNRVLYPYNYQLQLQQGEGFYRFNATGNYFFNYAKGGGMNVRLFAAKFGFVGSINNTAYLYQPKLLAGNGGDDYTNSNYFIGRTASTGFGDDIPLKNGGLAAQQVMIQNTGGLKLRLDPYGAVQGYSENWVAAINLTSSLPEKLFPVKLPVKLFFDAGSYSEAWAKNDATPRFLYVGGLQLSLFKNILNIYVPLLYSKAFKDQLKTNPEDNKFFKKVTFSIDVQNLGLKKLIPQFAL